MNYSLLVQAGSRKAALEEISCAYNFFLTDRIGLGTAPIDRNPQIEVLVLLAAVLAAPSRSAAVRLHQRTFVERFDTESYSDFSAKRSNFIGLVLFCIDAKFARIFNIRWRALDEIYKIYMLLHSGNPIEKPFFCTAQASIFQEIFVTNFGIFSQNFKQHRQNFAIFATICAATSPNFVRTSEVRKVKEKMSRILPEFAEFEL